MRTSFDKLEAGGIDVVLSAIFVPEKPERDWWMIAKDLITVGAQMATIYLVIQQAVN